MDHLLDHLLAILSSLLLGSFLYYQFGQVNRNPGLEGWQWYEASVLLAALGLSGLWSKSSQIAETVLGLVIAPTLVFCIVVVYMHPAESMWPIILPLVAFFSVPTPIIGSAVSGLLRRTRTPKPVYVLALTCALVIGFLLPNLTNPRSQKLETQTVPGLLKQIYQAEVIYRAHRPDSTFACDGALLPGPAGKLGWVASGPTNTKSVVVSYYVINLDCPNEVEPRSFRVTAHSVNGYILAPRQWIDETGQLVVEPITSTSRYAR